MKENTRVLTGLFQSPIPFHKKFYSLSYFDVYQQVRRQPKKVEKNEGILRRSPLKKIADYALQAFAEFGRHTFNYF